MSRVRLCWFFRAVALACGLAAAAAAWAQSAAEAGAPVIKTYTWRDFQAHHQMWSALEDDQGLMLFGNKGFVIEFDGAAWKPIPIGQTTFVRGLARGPDHRIYVGGVDELGYLEADAFGQKRFVSLRDRLPPEHRDFADVWRIVANRDGVYFSTSKHLLRWAGGQFRIWPQAAGDTRTYWLHESQGEVFAHLVGDPVYRIAGDSWIEVTRDPRLAGQRDVAVLRDAAGQPVFVTGSSGLLRVTATGTVEPVATDADAFLRREGVLTAFQLRDGSLLLGTRTAGLVHLTREGRFLRRLTEADGLPDPAAKAYAYDRAGQLWLALNGGLARLDVASPATVFRRADGLPATSMRATARHRGLLHVATGDGVYRLQPSDPATLRNAHFEKLPNLAGRFYSLASTPHGLIAGENDAVCIATDDDASVIRLPLASAVTLVPSRHDDEVVWAGTLRGLVRIHRVNGEWRADELFAGIEAEIRHIFEGDAGTLWVASPTRGVWRVTFAPTGEADRASDVAGVRHFGREQGVPLDAGMIHLGSADGKPLVFSRDRVWRFDAAAERFTPVNETAPTLATGAGTLRPAWHMLGQTLASSRRGTRRLAGYNAEGTQLALHALPTFDDLGEVQYYLAEPAPPSDVLWLSGSDALGRISLDAPARPAATPATVLQGVSLDAGAPWPADGALPPGRHDVGLYYTASAFARRAEFQTKLEGYDAAWSAFSAERSRRYTNLPAGRYTFLVRARDGQFGAPGPETGLAFTVPPPWWAAWWGRAGAAVGAIGFVTLGVRWRVRRLRQRNEELEQQVAARTAELQASEEQLRGARDAAEAANHAKSAFLAHMSHELRTPLNGILGYAEILRRDASLSATNRERLRVVAESGEHLLGLINEVLDLARVEAGRMELSTGDVSLSRLAQSVADLIRPRAAEKGLAFEFTLAPGLPRVVRTDEQKLRQILLNLLGNAVKFTAQGRVALAIAPARDGRVRFAVEDTGPGIPRERRETIFQPFETTAASTSHGAGLGLTVSARMAELLGGRIQLESTPGAGSLFWFDLPLPAVESREPFASAAESRVVTGYAGPRQSVLVVDDDATNRAVLRELLATVGFHVREAADADAALAAFVAQPTDLVLLDLRFVRGADGFAIAREVRKAPGGASTRIVAVSASVFESDRHEALAAGCDGFLPKPCKAEQLFNLIGSLLALAWDYATPAPAERTSETGRLPATELSALRALVRSGDVRGLRDRLATLREKHPDQAPFLRRLEELAAGFDLKHLRELLATASSAS